MPDTEIITTIESHRMHSISDTSSSSPKAHRNAFSIAGYIRHLSSYFGGKFVALLATNYFFLKGMIYVCIQGVQLPYFKLLGVDGVTYQMLTVISTTPWAMKGIIGALSDSFALGGFHKRYYMLISCIWGSGAILVLSFFPIAVMKRFLWVPPILFFLVHYQVATVDLLCEGKYTEKMAENPESRSDIVTFVWGCITLGSLAASCLVGPIADHLGTKPIFWLILPMALHIAFPISLGFLPEQRVPPEFKNKFQKQKILEKGPFFLLAVVTALGALILAILSLVAPPLWQFIYCIASSIILASVAYKAMPRQLANCNLYMYIQECLYVSLAGAIDFWYTANPKTCVPGGPGFDYTYYQTYTQLVGHTASVLALWLFQITMSGWKFRHVYWTTTLLRVGASFFDFMLIKRWNIKYLGISDKAMYLIGDAIILPLCTMLNFMPGVILTAKLCPNSMESTVYAILAGFSNFGFNSSKAFGVYLQQMAGINTQEPYCDFSKLPFLIAVCHGLLPLLAIPLTFVLLPSARMDEPLLQESTSLSRSSPTIDSARTLSFKNSTISKENHNESIADDDNDFSSYELQKYIFTEKDSKDVILFPPPKNYEHQCLIKNDTHELCEAKKMSVFVGSSSNDILSKAIGLLYEPSGMKHCNNNTNNNNVSTTIHTDTDSNTIVKLFPNLLYHRPSSAVDDDQEFNLEIASEHVPLTYPYNKNSLFEDSSSQKDKENFNTSFEKNQKDEYNTNTVSQPIIELFNYDTIIKHHHIDSTPTLSQNK